MRGVCICDNQHTNKHTLIMYETLYQSSNINCFFIHCGDYETYYGLFFNKVGTLHIHDRLYKWYFKSALDVTLVMLRILNPILKRDVSRLVTQKIWETRNDMSWG